MCCYLARGMDDERGGGGRRRIKIYSFGCTYRYYNMLLCRYIVHDTKYCYISENDFIITICILARRRPCQSAAYSLAAPSPCDLHRRYRNVQFYYCHRHTSCKLPNNII